MKTRAIILATLLTTSFGCQQALEADMPTQKQDESKLVAVPTEQVKVEQLTEAKAMEKNMSYKGTIKYLSMEGGFFGIVTDKGERFLPSGIPKELLTEGAIIEFSGNIQKDVYTIQQWGTPFIVKNVKLIKAGEKVKPGNGNATH